MDIRFLRVLHASFALLVHISGAFAANMQVGNASVECIERERQSLLALKQGFVDPDGMLSSWGSGESQKECCDWGRVLCDERGHVVELYLFDSDLEGTITPSLAELRHLKHLDLSFNNFNMTEFPKFITSLACLEYLDLSSTNLKGKIPKELGNLFSLQKLYLRSNQLEGGIPKSLALCNLYELDLSNNSLSGQLDEFAASYSHCANTSLQHLDLSYNEFVGPLPYSLGLCSLCELHLQGNSLSGEIDELITSFSGCAHKSLRVLDLTSNRFAGPLPDFSRISSLQLLSLGSNKLNGTLSDSVGQLSNLTELRIGNNSLQGVISTTHFLRLSQLSVLDLSFNDLVFNINSDWVPPFQANSILLASCKLGPPFPLWLQNQKSCSELDISSAEISDTLPNWFWDPSFTRLNISHNQIIGEISNLPFYDAHVQMDLSSNLFEGLISSNFSQIIALDLSNNKFTDASYLLCPTRPTSLTFLDLSNNQLSGVLPDCWINLNSLVFLNVANNSLFGNIPRSMGNLTNIQALHLSHNKLMGEIPSALNNCRELRTFDVAQNNFSGLVPNWIGGLKKLRVLSLRSNLFSGSLPSNICYLSQIQILDISMNKISGSLPKCINHLSALADQKTFDPTISQFIANEFSGSTCKAPNASCPDSEMDSDMDGNMYSEMDSVFLVWKGKESKYQSILGLVKSIDLSNNMLVGEIPSELMDLIGLISLNISRNMINGQIPIAIGRLKLLDSFDLSRNFLCGKIPSELSHIDRLSVVDLSYNNLSGEIPHGTQL